VEQLFRAIATAPHIAVGQLAALVRLVMDNNKGPVSWDKQEFRRIYDRCRLLLERPPYYDRVRHLNAKRGTRARIRDGSPDLLHAVWCGWFPVKRLPNGEWIIERQLDGHYRFLTLQELEEQVAPDLARDAALIGPGECHDHESEQAFGLPLMRT
jgi:hypothetical protein